MNRLPSPLRLLLQVSPTHRTVPVVIDGFLAEKKRRTVDDGSTLVAPPLGKLATARPTGNSAKSVNNPRGHLNEPARSTVIEKLTSLSQPGVGSTKLQSVRSYGHKRDERLALVENLSPGPYQHANLPDDPNFDKFEPHSSIRLSYVSPASRNWPHP